MELVYTYLSQNIGNILQFMCIRISNNAGKHCPSHSPGKTFLLLPSALPGKLLPKTPAEHTGSIFQRALLWGLSVSPSFVSYRHPTPNNDLTPSSPDCTSGQEGIYCFYFLLCEYCTWHAKGNQ